MNDSLAMLRTEATRFRDEREWAQFHRPKDLILGLGIEVAELAELFLWKSDAEVAALEKNESTRRRIAEELADVQLFLLYLSDRFSIPLDEAVREKLRENARKYPVEKARGR